MQWMSIPEVTYNIAAVGQAGPFLRKIGNTFAVDYYTALEWASDVGRKHPGWEGKAFFRARPEPSAVARVLQTVLGALPAGRVRMACPSHSAPLAPRVVPDSVRISTSGGGAACFQPELPGRPAVSQIRLIAPAVIGAAGEHVRGRKRVINVASNVLHVPGKRVGRARAKTCQPSHACLFPVFQSLI